MTLAYESRYLVALASASLSGSEEGVECLNAVHCILRGLEGASRRGREHHACLLRAGERRLERACYESRYQWCGRRGKDSDEELQILLRRRNNDKNPLGFDAEGMLLQLTTLAPDFAACAPTTPKPCPPGLLPSAGSALGEKASESSPFS